LEWLVFFVDSSLDATLLQKFPSATLFLASQPDMPPVFSHGSLIFTPPFPCAVTPSFFPLLSDRSDARPRYASLSGDTNGSLNRTSDPRLQRLCPPGCFFYTSTIYLFFTRRVFGCKLPIDISSLVSFLCACFELLSSVFPHRARGPSSLLLHRAALVFPPFLNRSVCLVPKRERSACLIAPNTHRSSVGFWLPVDFRSLRGILVFRFSRWRMCWRNPICLVVRAFLVTFGCFAIFPRRSHSCPLFLLPPLVLFSARSG